MVDSGETLLIGVDGGGTGCRVAVGTAAQGVLAETTGERANISSDPDGAIANICAAVLRAAQQAGRDEIDLGNATVHLGLAGVMSEDTAQFVAQRVPYRNCVVTDDAPTAVMGALGGADGFLAAIGTGTFIAVSRNHTRRYVGGWGLNVADQASGAWLGREALNRTLLCHDGLMRHSNLTLQLLAHFENDPANIADFGNRAMPGDFGLFCPEVVQAAKAGDDIGVALMELGADYILQSLKALEFGENDVLCLGGGVGPQYADFLTKRRPLQIEPPKESSAVGAFLLAMRASQNAGGDAP